MTTPLAAYLCLCIHNFAIQSTFELHKQFLSNKAFALFDSSSHLKEVKAVNALASTKGVRIGMSKVQASLIDDVTLLPYSISEILAMTSSIMTACWQFTPFIEDRSTENQCILVLDITGTERLFTSFDNLANQVACSLANLGFSINTAISHNFHTALLIGTSRKALPYAYIAAGEERRFLAGLPFANLPLNSDQSEVFSNWGVSTLHDVSQLPVSELVSRMGEQAISFHQMACGCHPHNFVPIERPSILKETFAYDAAVDSMESLLFTLSAMVKQLITRAESQFTSIACLLISIHLDNRETNSRVVRPGSPTVSHRLLLKLIQIDLESHVPGYGAIGLTVTAETGRSSSVQLGLFSPRLPEQSQLELTLARIQSLVGLNNVGTPILEDSHRQYASAVNRFAILPTARNIELEQCHSFSMRRLRIIIPMTVSSTGLPGSFIYSSTLYSVRQVYGPWATSGRWWDQGTWNYQQWDVIASGANRNDLLYCCISSTTDSSHWILEGIYD